MRIALCFLGLYRNFGKNYKNLFKTFIDDKKYETDIYLSTWEEKDYCIESRVKKLIPREIFIDVERQNNRVSEGYKMFGAQYNQLYKQRRVSNLIKKVDKLKNEPNKKPIKTWSRNSTIIPEFVGHSFMIHNGKSFIPITISEEMVGHKLGEFAPTRTFFGHTPADKKAKPAEAAEKK